MENGFGAVIPRYHVILSKACSLPSPCANHHPDFVIALDSLTLNLTRGILGRAGQVSRIYRMGRYLEIVENRAMSRAYRYILFSLAMVAGIALPLKGASQPAPDPANIQPMAELMKIQLVDLKGLKPGDEFIFCVATPKKGFAGYSGVAGMLLSSIPPQGPQDYDERLLRLEVSSVEVGGSVINI